MIGYLMPDSSTTVQSLKDAIAAFATERHWEPYHSPKNLCMAIASEVGEMCDLFRWLTAEESYAVCRDGETREAIADEMADVCNLLMLFSVHAGIDLSEAVQRKLIKNAVKYPPPAS